MYTRKRCSMRDTICKSKKNFKILEIILPRVILQGLYLNKPIKLLRNIKEIWNKWKWNNGHVPEWKNLIGNDANSSQLNL